MLLAGSSLLTLLDDIATLLDDISVMTTIKSLPRPCIFENCIIYSNHAGTETDF